MISENPDFQLIKNAYPMFGSSIQRLWGSKEFITYIKDLISSASSATAVDFPEDVLSALNRLAIQHDVEYHHLLPHADDNPDFKAVAAAFPNIAEKLSAAWGRKEFGPYMTGLLQNSRGDNRQGFPFDILMSLHALADQHNKDYANLFPAIDLWTQLSG
jgi:hypothetical protein